MYQYTRKDRAISRKEGKKNRLIRALPKLVARINADDLGFIGAVNAGLVQDDYSTINLKSLKAFIVEAKSVGLITAPIDNDIGRDQVVMELRRWH